MRFFLLFFSLVLSFSTVAQLDKVFISEKDREAFRHIESLKNGTLLVRLHTQSRAVDILKSKNRHREAQILIERNANRNKEIIKAFQSAFTFCEVYFFYSQNSNSIRDKNFDDVLVDENLNVIQNPGLDKNSTIYISDFGLVYFQAFGEYFEGVSVMNDKFELLEKPFPYYVRKRSGMAIFKRTNADMVLKLQDNLNSYYKGSAKYFSSSN